jgi:hypothetical protein
MRADARPCREPDGGHSAPRRAVVAQAGSQPLARGARRARRGRGRLGASELGRRTGELFGAACDMWGVSTLSDEARAGMCASCRGNAIFEHTCRPSWRYNAAAVADSPRIADPP